MASGLCSSTLSLGAKEACGPHFRVVNKGTGWETRLLRDWGRFSAFSRHTAWRGVGGGGRPVLAHGQSDSQEGERPAGVSASGRWAQGQAGSSGRYTLELRLNGSMALSVGGPHDSLFGEDLLCAWTCGKGRSEGPAQRQCGCKLGREAQ